MSDFLESIRNIFNGTGTTIDYVIIAILLTAVVVIVFFIYIRPTYIRAKQYDVHSNCIGHRDDILDTKTNIEKINNSLSQIRDCVSYIQGTLSVTPKNVVEEHSPVQVTESGYELMKLSGADLLLEKIKDVVIKELDLLSPKTALDVEANLKVLVYNHSNEDLFSHMKNYLYNNPKFKGESIGLNTTCFLMAIELRNEYLKIHPEIINPE